MQWLEPATEEAPPSGARRGPPRLPGLPDIPPMPVAMPAPAPTNKTIEVEPQWLEMVEERRAQAKQAKETKASVAPPPKKSSAKTPAVKAPVPAATKERPRPRIRPIPREDE